MSIGSHARAPRAALIALVLLVSSAGSVFGQAGWATAKESGFSFSYPADWNFIDLGADDYDGTEGFLKALSPPGEGNFALVVMLFPDFSLDLKAEKMTYADFMQSVFVSFLEGGGLKGLAIEETDAAIGKGRVPGYMVMETGDNIKAAIICGDLVKRRAALLIITMDLPADQSEAGKRYLELAEKILASFAFPK